MRAEFAFARRGMSTRNKAGARLGMVWRSRPGGWRRSRQHDQQRQAEAERHRQPDRGRARPVERRDAEADDRPAAMPQPARGDPQQQPEAGEQQHQPGNRADADGREDGIAGAGDGDRGGGCERQRRDAASAASCRSTSPTSPRSSCAGRVSTAEATGPQLAAKLISTPNRLASAKASHCGAGSGGTGSSRAGNRADQRRGDRADGQPDREGRGDDDQHLDDQHRVDRAAAGADQLQDGDGRPARGGEGGGRARHAEPADRQCRQGDQQQHLARPGR